MKTLTMALGLALAFAVAGCGGPKKASTAPAAKESPCVAAGTNVAAQLTASVATEDDATKHMASMIAPVMQKVMAEHCQSDAWSTAAIDCVTRSDAATMDTCTKLLTPEQNKAIEDAMQTEMSKMETMAPTMPMDPGATDGAEGGAPPAAPSTGGP